MSVDEYTREFEKLLIKCDIQEPESKQSFDTQEDWNLSIQMSWSYNNTQLSVKCVFWHTRWNSRRRETHQNEAFPDPRHELHPSTRGAQIYLPRRTAVRAPVQTQNPNHPYPSFQQNTPAPQKSYTPSNRPSQGPMNPKRCFKCQGLGHITADCPTVG